MKATLIVIENKKDHAQAKALVEGEVFPRGVDKVLELVGTTTLGDRCAVRGSAASSA